MVKSILIDENANLCLNNLIQNLDEQQAPRTGLLIGTIDQSRDFITFVLPTPVNNCDDNDPKDGIDSTWVVNHALLIHDMLIGGCDILGIYTVDQTPASSRLILTKIFKSLNELDYYREMKFNQERLLFLVDTKNKSINMKCLDLNVNDNKNYQSCEIKVEKNLIKSDFKKLTSNYELNSKFKIPNVKSHNLLKKDFLKALPVEEFFNDNKFLFLLNDQLLDDNKQFVELNQFNNASKLFAVILENLNVEAELSKKNINQENSESIYELNGVCSLIVAFHKSFKLKYVKKLLVYDLMRSFNSRVRLLVEDLDARKDIIGDAQLEDPNSNDVSSIEECYQTPNRIHIYLDENVGLNGQVISDYVFPDETDIDISERVKELLNVDLTDTRNQIVYAEDLPPEIKMSQSDDIADLSDGTQILKSSSSAQKLSSNQTNENKNGLSNNTAVLVSALAAFGLSVIIGYYTYFTKYANEESRS